jgi:hypothetical protein
MDVVYQEVHQPRIWFHSSRVEIRYTIFVVLFGRRLQPGKKFVLIQLLVDTTQISRGLYSKGIAVIIRIFMDISILRCDGDSLKGKY